MSIVSYLQALTERRDLTTDEMTMAMRAIMSGAATPAQIAGFLIALRMKGETVAEIAAAARVMREQAAAVTIDLPHLVDTCGTGGDGARTFNISTASAFVVAAAGGHVAKHGNRATSSQSGSADVLETAGAKIDLTPARVVECIRETGVGFMFAPKHHAATHHVVGPRRELGVRTLFNLLGPLTNPARTVNQVLGVYSRKWLLPLAEVLRELGSRHVWVVHAEDGLDEISIAGPTHVAELRDGAIRSFTITPEEADIPRGALMDLAAGDARESLRKLESALRNEPGPVRDIVCLNAGAAIHVCGLAGDWRSGVQKAQRAIADGKALDCFQRFIRYTQKTR
ncbi:MAG TPA: anthranilate phosphoribosyltransferase [Gammaproteobacteria bacterium]|nr:anthranilate phosphoribosyltransferase [Gammaproteobacteria bacterium]